MSGLVLAAGAGTRFGGPKALARLDGELFVERAVRTLSAGGCSPVLVVLGAAADRVLAEADLSGAAVVVAEDWAEGLSASLRAGLGTAEGTAVVITLVDQPWVSSTAVARLVATPGAAAIATYDGQRGHPVRLACETWADVSTRAIGEQGARPWLLAHPDLVVEVDCTNAGDPRDVDRPEDLA